MSSVFLLILRYFLVRYLDTATNKPQLSYVLRVFQFHGLQGRITPFPSSVPTIGSVVCPELTYCTRII